MKPKLRFFLEKARQFLTGQINEQLRHINKQLRLYAHADAATQKQLVLSYKSRILDGKKLPPLAESGFKRFSQTDEDGILLLIFSVIGTKNQIAVEICAGNGIECNSANLIINHSWYAVLFDGNAKQVKRGQEYYAKNRMTYVYPPKLVNAWITRDNVNTLIEDSGIKGEIDLLSLDMDGVDYWILKEITIIQPRVIVVEYQDILGPNKSVTVPYNDSFDAWQGPSIDGVPNFCGASLLAFKKLLDDRGYRLVGCNQLGYNAFFVRNDLICEAIPECEIESCFTHPKVIQGMKERYPSVAAHPWVEV